MTEALIFLAIAIAMLAFAMLALASRLGTLGLSIWIHVVHLTRRVDAPPSDIEDAEWWKGSGDGPLGE